MMRCPICDKGELQQESSIKGLFVKRKEITTFCPICEFTKVKKIKISKEDSQLETVERLNKKVSEKISHRKGGWER